MLTVSTIVANDLHDCFGEGLVIVAAVLGVIKTMGAISEPPEVLGRLIGGAAWDGPEAQALLKALAAEPSHSPTQAARPWCAVSLTPWTLACARPRKAISRAAASRPR